MVADALNTLEDKLKTLPAKPGVYQFIDTSGAIVYVGKAKSLRSRVRSYFQASNSDTRYFLPHLLQTIGDFETFVTRTEKEAAILENELIKRHQPRFNVKLRDDKDFLCIRLNEKAAWPRLETVRRPDADGTRHFGPYHSATSARRTLHLVNKHFQLRTCTDAEFAARKRPCLQYQIKRCPAPCVYAVDKSAYTAQVRAVALFLDGRHDELTRYLKDSMKRAAAECSYEEAALYRDQLASLESIRQDQDVVHTTDKNHDAWGLYREDDRVEVVVLVVRRGRVSEPLHYGLKGVSVPDPEVLSGVLTAHYRDGIGATFIPEEVLLPTLPDGAAGIEAWLSERAGHRTHLTAPSRGPRKALLELATENAAHSFREKRRSGEDVEKRLAELQERLRLPSLPRTIECCDISHLGGNHTVGAIIRFRDGEPDKRGYRSFHVRLDTQGDDYAAMKEVLERRFRRGRDDAGWELPDLFVVDGGRGQLGVALAVARDIGVGDLPIVGLAKERDDVSGVTQADRVFLPGQKNGIPLRAGGSPLSLLARARDEAHRFSNAARRKLIKKEHLRSDLEDVAGLGASIRQSILSQVGSLERVRLASDETLLACPGVKPRHVKLLRAYLSASPGVQTTAPALDTALDTPGEDRDSAP